VGRRVSVSGGDLGAVGVLTLRPAHAPASASLGLSSFAAAILEFRADQLSDIGKRGTQAINNEREMLLAKLSKSPIFPRRILTVC